MGKRVWSRERIISELQRIKQEEGEISPRYLQHNHRNLYTAIIGGRYFTGTSCGERYDDAIAAAGFKPEEERFRSRMRRKRKWSQARIIAGLLAAKDGCGAINPAHLFNHHKPLYGAITVGFDLPGTSFRERWEAAVKAAGLDPKEERRQQIWSLPKIVGELRRIKQAEGQVNPAHLHDNHLGLYNAVAYGPLFEGAIGERYEEALRQAGLDPQEERFFEPQQWSRGKIIEALRALAQQGVAMTPGSVLIANNPLYNAIKDGRYFHGDSAAKRFDNAVVAAGLTPQRLVQRWSKEIIVGRLQRLKQQGKSIAPSDLPANLYGAIRVHFKGEEPSAYTGALVAAGLNPEEEMKRPHRLWSRETVVSMLRQVKEAGECICPSCLWENHGGLEIAIRRFFPGDRSTAYDVAVITAGFDPAVERQCTSMKPSGDNRLTPEGFFLLFTFRIFSAFLHTPLVLCLVRLE